MKAARSLASGASKVGLPGTRLRIQERAVFLPCRRGDLSSSFVDADNTHFETFSTDSSLPSPAGESAHDKHPESMPSPTNPRPDGDQNEWLDSGIAAWDFRSDSHTTPTASMLAALTEDVQFDGLYGTDSVTQTLESRVAALTGCEAAIFLPSGTMANHLALRSLADSPLSTIVCDARSRIVRPESGSTALFLRTRVDSIFPANGINLTVEDLKNNHRTILHDNSGDEDTVQGQDIVISLENTLAGVVFPLNDIRRISEFARNIKAKLHLDGARLWEAVAAGAGSLAEYCSSFDTVSLSFSKGLGAPAGGMLVGTQKVIEHVKRLRRSIGGDLRRAEILSATCKAAVERSFGSKHSRAVTVLGKSHTIATHVAKFWVEDCKGKLKYPVDTNVVWLDLADDVASAVGGIAKEHGLLMRGGRLMMHYQISDGAVAGLEKVLKRVATLNSSVGDSESEA